MATFSVKNFFKNNSPKFIQIIGDIGLLASFISGNILIFKQSLIDIGLTSLANNPTFDKINTIALAIGVSIKFASKFFGIKSFTWHDLQPEEVTEKN